MEYSIQEVAKAAGTTSRTLRHYDQIGLLRPSRVGGNGYRFYDDRSLVRLQRVLLLRGLGLGLGAIAEVLQAQDAQAGQEEPAAAEARVLSGHLDILLQEQADLAARIASVQRTIAVLHGRAGAAQGDLAEQAEPGTQFTHEHEGGGLMAHNIFDGFDHTRHREEVEHRWGAEAYAAGAGWWEGLDLTEQSDWKKQTEQLSAAWTEAAKSGVLASSAGAQHLSAQHVAWLRGIPGTPAAAGDDISGYVLGLADMYVADERFAANYGGVSGAEFVRDALRLFIERA